MVTNEKESKQIYQFQVGYMLNPGLIINKDFREQAKINLYLTVSSKTMMPIKKILSK